MKKVAVIMGSASDLPVMEKAVETLKALDIGYTVRVLSAHRTPDELRDFARSAKDEGFGVVIAAAGMAAHLAGAVAANTLLPVIGVPIRSSFDGMDALLATVQMPSGIPVAATAVNGAKNAALLAAQILAQSDDALYEKLAALRQSDARAVLRKDAEISQTL